MKSLNFKNSSLIIFVSISIFYAIGNIVWWYLNTPIIPTNMAACHFLDVLNEGFFYMNAPLITWITKMILSIFGIHYFDLQIIILNYFFFLIALYFIYKIGLELKDKETGNIAMVLFALTPAVYGMSRQYGHQDWHVMVAITANIYCLIKLNDFKDRKWSILYGITVGLGLLVKDAFLAYFFVPWLYVAIRSLIEKTETKKIINILITILLGSLIAGCHYFRSDIINKILNEPTIEKTSIFTFDNIMKTTININDILLSPPIFLLFIIGLILFLFIYKNKNKLILLLWILVPWTIITFMPHHAEVEYFLGAIPAMILITSYIVNKNRTIKIISFLVFSICLFQYFFLSYNIDIIYGMDINNFSYKEIFYYRRYHDIMYYDNKRLKSILTFTDRFNEYLNKKIVIISTIHDMVEYKLCFKLKEYKNVETSFLEEDAYNGFADTDLLLIPLEDNSEDNIIKIAKFRYFLHSTKNYIEENEFIKQDIKRLKEIQRKINNNFYLSESIFVTNNKEKNNEDFIRIYKNKGKN